MTRVVVIGAGLGGLSAACHLAGRGHEVLVIEQGSRPGGRAGRLELGGYHFDTGPTVLTMPDIIESTFHAAGVDSGDLLDLSRLDPAYRATFADGSVIHVRSDRPAMVEEIRDTCGPDDARGFERLADWLTTLYRAEMGPFIDRNFDGPLDLVRPAAPLLRLVRLGALRRLSAKVGGFVRDERLRRLFTFQSMYAGLAPDEALAVFGVIAYMDSIAGVFVPKGGMHALPLALADAATKAGATFRYECTVAEIMRAAGSGRVRGVRLTSGETLEAQAVVCNTDLPAAYRLLRPAVTPPRSVRRARFSPSAVVWHVGLRGSLPAGTLHHNLHFGRAWSDSFRSLLKERRRMPDPSLFLTVGTMSDASLAPAGCHTLYVLEPVPNLDAPIDWAIESDRARLALEDHVRRLGYQGQIEVEAFHDPSHWAADGMERGTPFSFAHRFFQSGPFRPSNVDGRVPGLVFVGSGTVPGIGIPLVLLSGKLAASRVQAMSQ